MPRRLDLFPDLVSKDWWGATNYPRQLLNQKFATVLKDKDFSESEAYECQRFKIRPRMPASTKASGKAEVNIDEKGFQVTLDLDDEFKLEDLEVNMNDGFIEIHGKHEEKKDDHGLVSREFHRQYMVPYNCDIDATTVSFLDISTLKRLTIKIPKGNQDINLPTPVNIPVVDETTGETIEYGNTVRFSHAKLLTASGHSKFAPVLKGTSKPVVWTVDNEPADLQRDVKIDDISNEEFEKESM